MASKPMRITDAAEHAALQYGSTVSKGIIEMEFRLKQGVQNATPKERFMNTPIPFDKAYWDRWHIEIEALLEKLKRGEF